MKQFYPCLHSLHGENSDVWEKNRDAMQGSHLLENSYAQTLTRFSRRNMFYFFYEIIIFPRNKEIDDIISAFMFSFIFFIKL